jgi:phage terminase large subunit
MASLAKRLDDIEPRIMAQSGKLEKAVYGVVDKVVNGRPHCVRKWQGTIGNMKPSRKKPNIYIAEKLEPVILKHKKYKCLYGGRAGTKSIAGMDIAIGEVTSNGTSIFCLRERMKSLSQSIFKGIEGRISALNFGGFRSVESKWQIPHASGGGFAFGGLANVQDMKSLFEYKIFLLEEAAETSQEALDILGPTLRGVDGAEIWLLWNPLSANDPMSTEFIVPYQECLDRDGYYEDDYHLIINIGFKDNPWFWCDSSLVEEYQKDTQKAEDGRMSRSRYNHIWHGAFNDDVEDTLILADWFDACVDAHIKLGFDPKGAKVVTHDPSDVGNDEKGYACRHGVVFTDVREIEALNANDAIDMACGLASNENADSFGWDCDGLGAPLRNQVEANFRGKSIRSFMFKGSESPYGKDSPFMYSEEYSISDQKTVGDVLANKRAQNYVEVAERMRKTYEAVMAKEKGVSKYFNPDELISFSGRIPKLQKLRAELSKIPTKPNGAGKILLYTKEEMRRGITLPGGQKIVIPSPNMGDCVMMSFDNNATITPRPATVAPRPMPAMGITNVRTRRY